MTPLSWAVWSTPFLRHADRVEIACVAQLVNVIAPIMTENGGKAWHQTICWPFHHASWHGRGVSMDVRIDAPSYGDFGGVRHLDASAVLSKDEGTLSVSCVNRAREPKALDLRAAGFGALKPVEHAELRRDDSRATNTAESPCRVAPKELPMAEESTLAPLSYNYFRYSIDRGRG
jgi:alpha-N-arabinofuranosidase